jgi:sec-independent protein translocase protein TatA
MAGLTPAHILLILFIALIVIGPGKLPQVGAAVGKSVREFKRATGDLQETLTGTLNAQAPTPARAQAPLPAAYPPQAPYQPATGVVVPPSAPLSYPAPLGYPAPAEDPAKR